MLGSSLALRRVFVSVAPTSRGASAAFVAMNLAVAAARAGVPAALVDGEVESPGVAASLAAAPQGSAEVSRTLAAVAADACTGCAACVDACTYGAIRLAEGKAVAFDELCRGCAACLRACTAGAIAERKERVGEIEWARLVGGLAGPAVLDVVSGRLDVGRSERPAVIEAARRRSAVFARLLTVIVSPAGVSRAAVAAQRGADVLVLVAEPTKQGVRGLERAVGLGRMIEAPIGVVVDGAGPCEGEVEKLAASRGVPVLARIPDRPAIAAMRASGGIVLDGLEHASGWVDELFAGVSVLAGRSAE
ncbi:MAG: hypothetical protein N3B11_04195 [Coriobacteriia bacterium]|nr:hypothetical protein [Coriobacteriia bacterium]